jgi:Leucine-rich repeat (LRR) protein
MEIMNLSEVPREFLARLSDDGRQLSLSGMVLRAVPEWLGNLTALTMLDLTGNQLTTAPDWVGNLTTLRSRSIGRCITWR